MEVFKNKNLTNSRIMQAIVETIAFFNLFDFPLTEDEIHQYLGVECGRDKIISVLSGLSAVVEKKEIYYFLKDRARVVDIRRERRKCAERKLVKAKRAAMFFRLIPWVKFIAVGNMIGQGNLKDGSDIDFFIITRKNRLWLARFFCAAMAKLSGQRPAEGDARDKLCLSFFVAEDAMNLEQLTLKEQKDPYFIYWLACLEPVCAVGGIYREFIGANGWIKKHLPNFSPPIFTNSRVGASSKPYNKAVDSLLNRMENMAEKAQMKIFPIGLKALMNKDTRVVANGSILKLHVNDRREEYREKWMVKMKEYL